MFDEARVDVLGPDLPVRPTELGYDGRDEESGYLGYRLTVGERLAYWLDWGAWSGGNEYSASQLVQEGPPVATFENGDTFLQLPMESDAVSLDHATFGVSRNELGYLCFFGAGLEETGSGSTAFDFAGYADGLAFIDGQTYRLFGSAVQFSEGFMGGRTLSIDLDAYEGAFGDTLDAVATNIGRIKLTDGNFEITGEGGLSEFSGQMEFQFVGLGRGVVGHFSLWRDNGDVIFGSFALDAT